jgi:hypothetical protein
VEKLARENASVTAGSKDAQEVLKKGAPIGHSQKHEAPVIGMNIGSTVNMGQYESLRADVWATVPQEGGDLRPQFAALRGVLEEVLEETVNEYRGE